MPKIPVSLLIVPFCGYIQLWSLNSRIIPMHKQENSFVGEGMKSSHGQASAHTYTVIMYVHCSP